MKFLLFVEGDVEHLATPEFLRRWLNPRLKQRVGIQSVKFDGCGDYLAGLAKKVRMYLKGPKAGEIIAIVGLLDLYGLPNNFFPNHLTEAQDRYEWGKRRLEGEVGQEKFRQFFAVHELEAWLLSEPNLFAPEVRNAFPGSAVNPEVVNFQQPPSKLLKKLFREKLKRSYRKVVDGCEIFSKLDPDIACRKCPHLKEMVDEMLRLAADREN